jgi:thiopeptide-type bacteriocin biosynthesis protein
VELQEALGAQYRTPFKGPDGDSYQNEVIIPYFNGAAKPHQTFRTNPQSHIIPTELPRKFAPGSEWMSLKLYSGNSVIEDTFLQQIVPMIEDEATSYQKWFFMRYGDPDWHIRLRFLGEPRLLYGELLPKLNRLLTPLVDSGELHKMELFTYNREMERYGGPTTMEAAESLFMEDSRLISKALQHLDEIGESLRWRLCLATMNTLLDLFDYGTEDKLRLITQTREMFGREFNEDVSLRKKLGLKYRTVERTLWADLDAFSLYGEKTGKMDNTQAIFFPLIAQWRDQVQLHCQAINHAYNTADPSLTCTKDSLVGSFLHMHNNRLFKAYGRQQELLMHDFLRRALYSRQQIAKKATGTGLQGALRTPYFRT